MIYRFDVGGLENGLVNIINRLAPDEFRHAIVCLEGFSDFRHRLSRADVELISLAKRPGKDLKTYARLWRTLKRLAPAILHTRNLPALDAQLVGACAGVPCRVHGEHGREIIDLHGANRKHNLLRRAVHPAIHEYVTVTADLRQWLINAIGVAPPDVHHIPNGVDTERFHPGKRDASDLFPPGFLAEGSVVVGSLSRMASVKDPLNLVRAFLQLVASGSIQRDRLRLVM
ncbi:MAG: glycosyltransferase, partial [Acidobacteria bacterium]|nr:glycosyltransferase [Acidobacteriota bacterium]